MSKAAELSIADTSPYGKRMFGLDILEDPSLLFKFVQQDHGLPQHKKKALLTMLEGPEAFDHLVAGTAGAALGKAVSSYAELSPPSQTLMSLAGFGLGNVLYNTLHEEKFTSYNPDSGKVKIKM
jgi:hypothetical protein